MGKCRHCKHWSEYSYRMGWGDCKATEALRDEPVRPDTLAYVRHQEVFVGSLFTNAEFGCIQFEATI